MNSKIIVLFVSVTFIYILFINFFINYYSFYFYKIIKEKKIIFILLQINNKL